jgi:hypothetical protein
MLDAKHDIPKEKMFIFDTIGQPIPEGFKGWKTLLEHGEVDWCAPSFHSNTPYAPLARLWQSLLYTVSTATSTT